MYNVSGTIEIEVEVLKMSPLELKATDRWPEVFVRHASELSEALAHRLFEMGARAVVQEEEPEENRVLVVTRAGFGPERALDDLRLRVETFLDELAAIFEPDRPSEAWYLMTEAGGWSEKWKEGLEPIAIGNSIVIKPSWVEYTGPAGVAVIELDPGLAFGTGRHASTYMCLTALEKILERTRPGVLRVLDVGTGSGILALAAAALGQTGVVALDNDIEAMPVARDNLAANGLADRVRLLCAEPAAVNGRFDLVLANLTAGVLIDSAPDLARLTAPGGRSILSGILREQADEVIKIFESAGFSLAEKMESDEWSALVMELRA
jgi:ribosomal protein L11 methyltransferase